MLHLGSPVNAYFLTLLTKKLKCMSINFLKELAGLVLENALQSQFYVQSMSQLRL